jgi:hypothetical protein
MSFWAYLKLEWRWIPFMLSVLGVVLGVLALTLELR